MWAILIAGMVIGWIIAALHEKRKENKRLEEELKKIARREEQRCLKE